MAVLLKIEKKSNGNVAITQDGVIVASLSGSASIVPHRKNDNLIVIGGGLEAKEYRYDYMVDASLVGVVVIGGVDIPFVGDRNELLELLSSSFFNSSSVSSDNFRNWDDTSEPGVTYIGFSDVGVLDSEPGHKIKRVDENTGQVREAFGIWDDRLILTYL